MAWTAPKTWTAGETLTAANFNTHIRDNGAMTMHTLARKSADETVISSTTLQNDDHLFFSVAVNEVWFLQAWLMYESSATADLKIGWTTPAGATITWGANGTSDLLTYPTWSQDASAPIVLATTGTLFTAGSAVGVVTGLSVAGIAAIGGTAGTVQLQWAQNTSDATNTKVKLNSALIGCRLV